MESANLSDFSKLLSPNHTQLKIYTSDDFLHFFYLVSPQRRRNNVLLLRANQGESFGQFIGKTAAFKIHTFSILNARFT